MNGYFCLNIPPHSSPLHHLKLARLLEHFPREGQFRAEVVITFYHKVRDLFELEHNWPRQAEVRDTIIANRLL